MNFPLESGRRYLMPGSDVVLLPFPLLLLLVSLFVYICLFVYVSFVFAPVSSWRLLALLMGKLSSLLICGGWLRRRWSWLCLRSPTWFQSGTVYLLEHSPGTFHLLEKVKTPSHSWFYLVVINYSDSKYVCYVPIFIAAQGTQGFRVRPCFSANDTVNRLP